MIVLLVLGLVMLTYALIKGATRREIRWFPIIVGLILVVSMGLGLHRAQTSHFLMTKTPVDKTQKIAPATTINGLKLITTQTGSDGELRYTYSIGKKTYQTMTQNATTTVKSTDKQASLNIEVMTYQVNSAWRRFLLLGQPKFEKGTTSYTLSVPKDWYIIPANKVATLQKMVKDSKAIIADEVAKQVKQQFADKAKDDKDFLSNTDAQNKLKDQIVTDVTNKANDDLHKALIQKIESWHK